ncbi:MAG: glycosyltransferase family 4 protein [Planctomycetota bacterium]
MNRLRDENAARRAVVSVMGRFHAFDLARELDRRGRLERLFTSYPASLLPRFGVDASRGTTSPWIEVSARAMRRVAPERAAALAPWFAARYDRFVALALREGAGVFVGWSGQCLASLRRARDLGMRTIVERGSAHIVAQHEILSEEFARHGIRPALPHPAIVERELAEYEYADFVQVPSRFALRTFVERGVPHEKLLVNPYGVDLRAFSPAEREPRGFVVLFCGRASVQKGVAHLVRAFEAFDAPDAELWIQGAVEPDAESVRANCRDPRVKWLGHSPQHELPQVYRRAHVLCLPSIQDGFGLVVPQAMACGLPAIVSTNAGASDLVRDGVDGFTVPPADAASITASLEALYSDRDLLRTMSLAARERVDSGWSWEDYGRRAAALLDHVLDRSDAPSDVELGVRRAS